MPRQRPLPTPASSTDLPAKEKIFEMDALLTLPPATILQKPESKHGPSPPTSPYDLSSPQRKRTLSGATKSREESTAVDLPPPPSRARKIIQMKPKPSSSPSSLEAPALPQAKTTGKRKQPSTTSVAGRKIARKTAHSIIERRRRSKMNEEFGVLKDMIPACEGAEMHKLAILQAGIEYVRYLEDCISQLKGENGDRTPLLVPSKRNEGNEEEGEEDEEDEDDDDDEKSEAADLPAKRIATNSCTDWQYRKLSTATTSSSPDASPDILPQLRSSTSHRPALPSISSITASPAMTDTPSSSLLSPAFNAIQFSPDLARSSTNSTGMNAIHASPNILPLPQALMALDRKQGNDALVSEGQAEATATVALMMLTNDRRGVEEGGRGRGKAMSVRDLLTS